METELYFKNNQMAIDVFNAKYTLEKENGEKENVLEVFTRVAHELAKYEKESAKWEAIWTNDMMEGWYRPAGSILFGVGNPSCISLANCTTIPLEDDSIVGINKCISDMMLCASRRQGLGVDVSKLRPRGAKVNNSANESTGAVPWMDYLQSMGNYVGQSGRRPAVLLSLNCGHPDIEEFIKSKTDLKMIQNANISVQITDEFMKAVQGDEDWELHFETRHEKISRTVRAKDLFTMIATAAHASAEPGVQFIDEMRRGSMIHQIYKKTGDERFAIRSTNACSEKPLAPYGICLLGSLNMGMFPNDSKEYTPLLKEKSANLTRLLDNAIQYEIDNERYGVPEQKYLMEMTREIGMGFTNLHQWFLNADLQYDSDEAVDDVLLFMQTYACSVFEASQALAEEKGPAKAYKEFDLKADDLMPSSFFSAVYRALDYEFPEQVKPLRNLALMSIAPTGSLSMTFPDGCISSGLEPVFAPAYWRKTRAVSKGEYDYYFVLPDGVKQYLLTKIPADTADAEFIQNVSEATKDNTGDLGKEVMALIEQYLGEGFFKPAHEINYMTKLEMMSCIYEFIDAAASVTYNLPENIPISEVEKIYQIAWESGVRAVSIYREGSREGILTFDPPGTQKEKKLTYCDERPHEIPFNCAPKRPKDVPCDIHHCKVMGKDWIVLVGLHGEFPYEIFAGEENKEEMYIPTTVKEGILRKVGRQYSLIITIRKSEVEYKDIASLFMNERYRSITRLISLSLRHGVRPAFIIDQLKKANEGITEFSSVVCRVLQKYMKQLEQEYLNNKDADTCPFCGSTDWIYQGSCKICASCSKGSKCD